MSDYELTILLYHSKIYRHQYQILDILIEFKFVSLKEAGVDGKTLEIMDSEAPWMLPAVQSKQREAETSLARYRAKLKDKFSDLPRLHSFSVVAVGFERLVFSWSHSHEEATERHKDPSLHKTNPP